VRHDRGALLSKKGLAARTSSRRQGQGGATAIHCFAHWEHLFGRSSRLRQSSLTFVSNLPCRPGHFGSYDETQRRRAPRAADEANTPTHKLTELR
jgi:hypothetical protein